MVLIFGTANASTLTTFDINGTSFLDSYQVPFYGTLQFSGTLTVDVGAGVVTAIDIDFQGLNPDVTDLISSFEEPSLEDQPAGWGIDATNGIFSIFFVFQTTAPGSLVGFDGGPIIVGPALGGGDPPYFFAVTSGEVTAATPLPAALPLFATGLGAIGLLGWRRKRKAGAAARLVARPNTKLRHACRG